MCSLQAVLIAATLSAGGETVLLDFYSETCGPCRAMAPTIQELAKTYPVRKIDVEKQPALAAEYRVRSVPCFVMLVDGREVDRVLGGTSFSRLQRMCGLATAGRSPGRPSSPPRENVGEIGLAVRIPATDGPTTDGPVSTVAAASDSQLIAASVRLRIEDSDGHSCGSGTIVDARDGEALILTCGHIFRESQGRGRIEVDLYGPAPSQRIAGRLISYDLKRDVGLVCIRVPGPVAVARVAAADFRIRQGDPVISVGCNNGDRPTARHSRVASLNKFLGPPNVQVDGEPVEGRSGGGLFSMDGKVLGVCNAADPSDREGLYAALESIHAELDRAGLSQIIESPPAGRTPRAALVAVRPPPMPKRMPRPTDRHPGAEAPAPRISPSRGDTASLSAAEQAAVDEIRQRLRDGAEVICVIRSRRDPQAKSEVIMLDQVSPEFLERLAAEARSQGSHNLVPTSRRQQP